MCRGSLLYPLGASKWRCEDTSRARLPGKKCNSCTKKLSSCVIFLAVKSCNYKKKTDQLKEKSVVPIIVFFFAVSHVIKKTRKLKKKMQLLQYECNTYNSGSVRHPIATLTMGRRVHRAPNTLCGH